MRVVVVEDSRVVQQFLRVTLGLTGEFDVVGVVDTEQAAVAMVAETAPDVVLMDLQLRQGTGIGAIRRIVARRPCPIVVFSSLTAGSESRATFDALAAGALDVVRKPGAGIDPRVAAERVIAALRRLAGAELSPLPRRSSTGDGWVALTPSTHAVRPSPRGVVIGASTGGPPVLQAVLRAFEAPFPLPIVVAQHISPGFEDGLAQWLSATGHRATVLHGRAPLASGALYVAPADGVTTVESGDVVTTSPAPPGIAPSVNALFASAAQAWGAEGLGILLTGMGRDGADGLLKMRVAGARTWAQCGSTCVVNGMPEAARQNGAAEMSLTPGEIGRSLHHMAAALRGAWAAP